MKKNLRRLTTIAFLLTSCLVAALALLSGPSTAATLSTAIVGMFPKEVGEFAYADLKSARSRSWFPQLRDQMLPSRLREFEQFLRSAGVDPDTQVDELAWGAIPASKDEGEQIVGVALGQFSPSAAEGQFKQKKLPAINVHGYNLYAFGSGSAPGDILFFFLDSNTAAFGHRKALERMIGVRFGESESLLRNDTLSPLITEANGSGLIWAVLNQSYTQLGLKQLLPQADQFPQAATIMKRIQAMVINVKADSGVDANFQAVCASPDDANLLAAALQAGVMYRRYQEQQANPELAKALDNIRISPRGERLTVEAPVSEEQMSTLIRNRTFAVPM